MKTLRDIKKSMESSEDLQSVVNTMKTLAAVSIRQYDQAVDSLKVYDNTLDLSFQIVLKQNPLLLKAFETTVSRRSGIIIIGSEQGMSGRFNEAIIDFSKKILSDFSITAERMKLMSVGSRIQNILNMKIAPAAEHFHLPGSVKGIANKVREILQTLETWRNEKQVDHIYLFYNRKKSGADYEPFYTVILPPDRRRFENISQKEWESNCLPQLNIDQDTMLKAQIREYIFITLYRGIAESLAGENASRLAAMQAAEKNIEEHLEELKTIYNHLRQTSITSELLDIVGGTEALR